MPTLSERTAVDTGSGRRTPGAAAGAVYLLCRPESDYVSGHTVVCGGGYAS